MIHVTVGLWELAVSGMAALLLVTSCGKIGFTGDLVALQSVGKNPL